MILKKDFVVIEEGLADSWEGVSIIVSGDGEPSDSEIREAISNLERINMRRAWIIRPSESPKTLNLSMPVEYGSDRQWHVGRWGASPNFHYCLAMDSVTVDSPDIPVRDRCERLLNTAYQTKKAIGSDSCLVVLFDLWGRRRSETLQVADNGLDYILARLVDGEDTARRWLDCDRDIVEAEVTKYLQSLNCDFPENLSDSVWGVLLALNEDYLGASLPVELVEPILSREWFKYLPIRQARIFMTIANERRVDLRLLNEAIDFDALHSFDELILAAKEAQVLIQDSSPPENCKIRNRL